MLLRLGSRGPAVRHCQHQLRMLGFYHGKIDGIFGPLTKAAVISFQKCHGLVPDGIIGPVTAAALHQAASGMGMGMAMGDMGMALRRGSRGHMVMMLQQSLQMHGYYHGAVDGIFGPMTEAAVIAFQSHHGLVPDGIVGPRTAAALMAA